MPVSDELLFHLDDAEALISLLQTWIAKSKTSTPDTTSEPTPTTK